MDKLLHTRISKKVLDKLQILIDEGLYNNQAEIIREGVRDILLKYKEEIEKGKKDEKKQ